MSASGESEFSYLSSEIQYARPETQYAFVAKSGANKRIVKKQKGRTSQEIEEEEANRAATKIQAIFRGYLTRKHLAEEIERVRGSSVAPNVEPVYSGEPKRYSRQEQGARDKPNSKDKPRLSGYINAPTTNHDSTAARKSGYDYSKTATSSCNRQKDKGGAAQYGRKEAKEKCRNKDDCRDDFKFIVFKALENLGSSCGGRGRRKDSAGPRTSGVTSVSGSNGRNGGSRRSSNRRSSGQPDDVSNSNRSANESSESSFWDEDSGSKTLPSTRGNKANQSDIRRQTMDRRDVVDIEQFAKEPSRKSGAEDDRSMAYVIQRNFESAACSSSRACRFSTTEPSKCGRPPPDDNGGGLSCRRGDGLSCRRGGGGSPTRKDGDSRNDRFSSYRSGGDDDDDYCKRFDLSCDAPRRSSRKGGCKVRFKSDCRPDDDDLDDCCAPSEESDDC